MIIMFDDGVCGMNMENDYVGGGYILTLPLKLNVDGK